MLFACAWATLVYDSQLLIGQKITNTNGGAESLPAGRQTGICAPALSFPPRGGRRILRYPPCYRPSQVSQPPWDKCVDRADRGSRATQGLGGIKGAPGHGILSHRRFREQSSVAPQDRARMVSAPCRRVIPNTARCRWPPLALTVPTAGITCSFLAPAGADLGQQTCSSVFYRTSSRMERVPLDLVSSLYR